MLDVMDWLQKLVFSTKYVCTIQSEKSCNFEYTYDGSSFNIIMYIHLTSTYAVNTVYTTSSYSHRFSIKKLIHTVKQLVWCHISEDELTFHGGHA